MNTTVQRSLSIELALVVGLPILTLIAGAITLALAYGRGFTPATATSPAAAPVAAPVALHGR